MGVKGLTSLLQRLAPQSVKSQHISHYKGKTLAVDVSCFLNRFIYGLDPHPARVQRGVYRLYVYLQLHGIKPIFVFDGEGRIVEKQREANRRAVVKQKIEKSFRLEKIRKSRLKGLKGSAQLLQNFSPEQVSSILEDIRLQESVKPVATGNRSDIDIIFAPMQGPNSPSDLNPSQRAQQGLDSLEHAFSLQDEAFENDLSWHIPPVTDAEQRHLEEHLSLSEDFYGGHAHLFQPNDEIEGVQITEESDREILEQLELDLNNIGGLGLDFDMDFTGNDDPQHGLRTGSCIESAIPAAGLAQLEMADPMDATYDAEVRQKVHMALGKFVQTMDNDQGASASDFEENATQKQKVLNELEKKLVQEIKEASRGNHARRLATKRALTTEDESEIYPTSDAPIADASQITLMPPRQPVPVPSSESNPVETNNQVKKRSSRRSGASQQPKSETLMDDSGHLNMESYNSREELTVDKLVDKSQVELLSGNLTEDLKNEPLMSDMDNTVEISSGSHPGVDSATETEEDRDLGSMIHDVLSAHQSIFMTLERRTLRVTHSLSLSCQALLKATGQPVIVAFDAEAEAVCARLTTLGLADASVSEDTDTAVFGNGLLLRQVGATGNKDIIEINPVIAHNSLGLSRDAFRDLCILCGTDFSGTIEGIGPYSAAKLMQYYGSIESIMANVDKKPREDFLYDLARRVFDRTPVVPEDLDAYQPKQEIQPLLLELMLKYEINHGEINKELMSGIYISDLERKENHADASENGSGSPFQTNTIGVDPFKLSTVSIPEPKGDDKFLEVI